TTAWLDVRRGSVTPAKLTAPAVNSMNGPLATGLDERRPACGAGAGTAAVRTAGSDDGSLRKMSESVIGQAFSGGKSIPKKRLTVSCIRVISSKGAPPNRIPGGSSSGSTLHRTERKPQALKSAMSGAQTSALAPI